MNLAALSQPGILAEIPPLARYLTFALHTPSQVRVALDRVRRELDEHCVFGLSAAVVQCLDANIAGLRPFPALMGAGVEVPSTPGAVWCWLRGVDRGAIALHGRRITAHLSVAFELIETVDAFKYDGGRDLSGYEDGTENPRDAAAVTTALVSGRGRGLDGSSFVAVQRWIHNLSYFQMLSAAQQDATIGRRRADNEELDEAPESAHVKRTAQESFSPAAFVVRRSMPWADATQLGLQFVAFGRSFDAFEAQLKRMLGTEDGIVDALFTFTRPVTGNYFWCPPRHDGAIDFSALGL